MYFDLPASLITYVFSSSSEVFMSVTYACLSVPHTGPDVLHFEMLCSPNNVGWLS